jgi:tRNA (mo5U34)-methyltransferase
MKDKHHSFSQLLQLAKAFEPTLKTQKACLKDDAFWYPYGTLNNFIHLQLFEEIAADLPLRKGAKVADVGAADGDLSFFLNTLGYEGAIIDHGPTNYNNLQGARLLATEFYPTVTVNDIDLDSQFNYKALGSYDMIVFLGILYHLKNPFYVLEAFSHMTRFMLVSTRVARFFENDIGTDPAAPKRIQVANHAVGYLLDPLESNNDPTNYWIFSVTGLHRLMQRSGWEILKSVTVGDIHNSNQKDNHRDERAFVALKSTRFASS